MFYINTIPGQAAAKKGFARYPEDFPHLTDGKEFTAWRSGDDWEIETILEGREFLAQMQNLSKFCKNAIRMWEIKYRDPSGRVDFLWYGNSVSETEARRRNQVLEAAGLEILDMRAINGLPANKTYLNLLEETDKETADERDQK